MVNYEKSFDGLTGLALDAIFRKIARKAAKNRADGRLASGACLEVKQGAGVLRYEGNTKALIGSTWVLYVPVPVWHFGKMKPASLYDYLDLTEQEGFLLPRDAFLEMVRDVKGLLRAEKASSQGSINQTLQTFYNRKQDKAPGRLYERFLAALYGGALPLEDALEQGLLKPWYVHTAWEILEANCPEGKMQERLEAFEAWLKA